MSVFDYFDRYCRRYRHYKGGAWCYEDGCIYRGLVLLHQATGEDRWLDHLLRLTQSQISADGGLAGYSPDEFNIDNVMAGRCLFHLDAVTGDPRYMVAALSLAGQLSRHPRISTGNYWHKKVYPHQVWLDGLYMALPFQIEYGQRMGDAGLIEDAIRQLLSALELTRSGIFYVHGYDDARQQPWADRTTGRSPAVWARAIGWLAMALVDSSALTADPRLAPPTSSLMAAIAREAEASGLWKQVLCVPDLSGNYEESSASAMLGYALLFAGRQGLGDFASAGRKAYDRLIAERLYADAEGEIRFGGICRVAGLGSWSGGPYRDGTPAYYLTEDVVTDDAKGVGPLMMAAAEALLG